MHRTKAALAMISGATISGLAALLPQAASALTSETPMLTSAHAPCPNGLMRGPLACVDDTLGGELLPYAVGAGLPRGASEVSMIRDPSIYGLDPMGTYYLVDSRVVQVNASTLQVERLVGAAAEVMN